MTTIVKLTGDTCLTNPIIKRAGEENRILEMETPLSDKELCEHMSVVIRYDVHSYVS